MFRFIKKALSNKPIFVEKGKKRISYSVNFPFITRELCSYHILGLQKANDKDIDVIIRNMLTGNFYRIDIEDCNLYYKKMDKNNLLFQNQLIKYGEKMDKGEIFPFVLDQTLDQNVTIKEAK